MANEFKSFYLKDVLNTIDAVAMDAMMTPMFAMNKKPDGTMMTLSEISAYNSLVSAHNEGVHEMAAQLKAKLAEDDDD